ncbi:MAG: ABC transporter substrate-binding protein [Candidatus Oxydemutatoraceae bacterium WSBS_2016_MAG_OTU14]
MLGLCFISGCDNIWNTPYADSKRNVLYKAFSDRPKHMDPVRSYSSNEYAIIGQIYEPPLQYHYLKRPYTLVPLTAKQFPKIEYFTDNGEATDDPAQAKTAVYEIDIRSGLKYQPHPAFARDREGRFIYTPLSPEDAQNIYELSDFTKTDTRELTAADYAYQIKRLADSSLHSPIAGMLAEHIVGFRECIEEIQRLRDNLAPGEWLDLRTVQMQGVEVLGRHRYRITVDASYPQFVYWLAMPFFAPIPWEADYFYSQTLLQDRNITLNWYPIGSGAYMLTENNPNLRMVLKRNPYFHHEVYPSEGMPGDQAQGLLHDAGKVLPMIDEVIFSLEKEDIPYWNKFLQGYYDSSGLTSDSFDQAIQVGGEGDFRLTDEMIEKGIALKTAITASIVYIGFNMKDKVVGGFSERAIKLRRALSIAIDMEEYISIFLNGRGIAAQGILPPDIFGYEDNHFNPYVYQRNEAGQLQRRSIQEARELLQQAGYANGIDRETGKPLVLYFDAVGSGPDAKSFLNWLRKQFAKLEIQLVIRNTDYNRFQQKMLNGNTQIFRWGWNGDYPDPENFYTLLYGAHAKVNSGGVNTSNYSNAKFDVLFEQMKSMPNNAQRQEVINAMDEILLYESPWIWGVHPQAVLLHYDWYQNLKSNLLAHNTLKYHKLDPVERQHHIQSYNRPILFPLLILLVVFALFFVPAVIIYRRKSNQLAL